MPVENKKKEKTFGEQQLVIFKLADEEFGVDINKVKEIIRWEDISRIPNAAPYIKGVINLRGSIVVVNDLAMKLGLPSSEISDDTRILIVEVEDNTVGMIVDSATEVLQLPGDKIKEAPSMVTDTIDHNFIEGVGVLDEKRLLSLLNLSKVLESKDYEQIFQAQKEVEKTVKTKTDTTVKDEKKTEDAETKIEKKEKSEPADEQTAKEETPAARSEKSSETKDIKK